MKKRLPLLVLLLIIIVVVSGCNGKGSLKVIVYDQQQNPVNDVYIGIYKFDFNKRVRFAYTRRGAVEFAGLESGVYYIRIISPGQKKEMKLRINSQEDRYLKVNLEN